MYEHTYVKLNSDCIKAIMFDGTESHLNDIVKFIKQADVKNELISTINRINVANKEYVSAEIRIDGKYVKIFVGDYICFKEPSRKIFKKSFSEMFAEFYEINGKVMNSMDYLKLNSNHFACPTCGSELVDDTANLKTKRVIAYCPHCNNYWVI